jgi:hypothetical protein
MKLLKCITPPALDDAQIVSYVDGEAEEAVVAHIKECPYCSARANQWSLLQNRLRKQSYRRTCPTPMELGDYHLGYLPDPQELVVAQHVRECPLCKREVAELEEFLAEQDSLKILIARLVSGGRSAPTPAVPALRGEAKGPLIYEAEDIVITLDIQPGANGQASIQGQVAADDQDQWTGAIVRLLQTDMPELTVSLDDLGAFGFEEVRPGSIQLRITSPNGIEVQIPDIDIPV